MLKTANKARAVNDKGLVIGEDHPRAVLTDHEVELVLELRAEVDEHGRPRYSFGWLAAKFEVSKSCIARICWGTRRAQHPVAFKRARGPGSSR